MFKRTLKLPESPQKSFFLWGPRQVGKSSLLKISYPNVYYVDLLKSDQRVRYQTAPSLLREELKEQKVGSLVIIDEIQLVPDLLHEVHYMIENQKLCFILCGSSARKLRRGAANLLGGRALRYELFGLVYPEIDSEIKFDILRILNLGYLPSVYTYNEYRELLKSYISDYLQEEIMAEGIVRNLPSFSSFLTAVALTDTEFVNFSNIASDCGVSSPTVREYYQILEDTMLGKFLEAYQPRLKRKKKFPPKFYFFDVGVVNVLAKRGEIVAESELIGKAFENWVFHELRAYISYQRLDSSIGYLRLEKDREIDFIINDLEVAIEVKATKLANDRHLRNLRFLKENSYLVKKRIIVTLDQTSRKTDDGILILTAEDFAKRLWAGELFK